MKAGNELKTFMSTKPFQDGFLGTPSQVGAGSSAGLVANGKAAMELQGDWDPGVMAPLTSDKKPTPSSAGSRSRRSPAARARPRPRWAVATVSPARPWPPGLCAEFLKYIDSTPVQKQVVGANVGLPANPAAASSLSGCKSNSGYTICSDTILSVDLAEVCESKTAAGSSRGPFTYLIVGCCN